MAKRICHICGNEATGFASIWTRETGELWYCHGDEDEDPTCYMRAGIGGPPDADDPEHPAQGVLLRLRARDDA